MTSPAARKLAAREAKSPSQTLAKLAGERGLFEPHRAVGERNSGPGDERIGGDFLVLVLIMASGERPRLGMMNCWRRRYVLKAKMTGCEE